LKRALTVILLSILFVLFYFVFKNRGTLPVILPPAKIPVDRVNGDNLGLNIPDNFSIQIFAKDLTAPRVLKFDENDTLLASIPKAGQVVALPDYNHDGIADKTVILANSLNRPHGLALKDGRLYVAEVNNVISFDYDSQSLKVSNKKSELSLPGGGRHSTRTIEFGPDGNLYISVGSTCDVCIEKDERNGTILTADMKSSSVDIFARGLRNSVFFIFHPQTFKIWATEMGRDFLGDKLPPDEINIIEKDKDYGWPKCYGNRIHDTVFDKNLYTQIMPQPPCGETQPPVFDICAHCAPLGLSFIYSGQFPSEWQGDLLISYHGSWNSTKPVGYKVVKLNVEGEKIVSEEDFITGFLNGSQVIGRPVDLVFDKKGNLFISDDKAGYIFILKKLT